MELSLAGHGHSLLYEKIPHQCNSKLMTQVVKSLSGCKGGGGGGGGGIVLGWTWSFPLV